MDQRTNAEGLPNGNGVRRRAGDGLRAWRFDGCEFDQRRGELKGRDGATIALRPKAESLLRQFLARPGQLLGREELMAAVWPATVVTDDSLVQCVGELRTALDDRSQNLIHTVPRRGYRFEAAVEPVMEASPALAMPSAAVAAGQSLNDADAAMAPPAPAVPTLDAEPIEAAAATTAAAARRPRRLVAGVALAVALALGGAAAWHWEATPARTNIDDENTARHVIAVMPFAVEGGEPRLRETADRVVDRIAAQIASHAGTRCIGRARTAAFEGAPLARIAHELGATYVFTGRVSPATAPGQAAVVEVQLVATSDGALIGAERFDLGAGLEAGEDLGQQAMNFVTGRVEVIDIALATRPGHQPSAAELTLLGWSDVHRRQGRPDMANARDRFERALRQDPDSIMALDGLGAVYNQERSSGVLLTAVQTAEAERAIDRALRLAPNDATAALIWANVQSLNGRPDLAIPAIEKSNRITPGFVNGHLMLGRALLSVGRVAEVQVEADRAVRLAALSRDAARASNAFQLGAEAALMQHDDARALDLARRAVAERPNISQAHAVLAAAEALSGHPEQAAAEMAICRRLWPGASIVRFDESRPSSEARYVAARARLYEGLRAAGMPAR